jgi:outer membrane protein
VRRAALSSLFAATLFVSTAALAQEGAVRTTTFAGAIATAKQRSTTSLVAKADIARLEGLMVQARSASFPTLVVGATYTRIDDDRIVGGRVALGVDSFGANITAAVPIFAPARWGAYRRADDAVDVSRAAARATDRDVALLAARAYFGVILQKRAVEVSTTAKDSAQSHLDNADARLGGGVGSRLDVVRARQEVELSLAQLANAESNLARARENLGVALGLDHAVDTVDVPKLPEAPRLAGSATDTAQRADLKREEASVWAARRANRDAWREYMPILSGAFQPFYQNPPTLTQPNTGWQAQLILSWPVYDGGLRYGLTRERSAVLSQAEYRKEALQRQSTAELRIAETTLERAKVALEKTQRAAALAHEAADLAMVAYKAGGASNLEVVDADRRARDVDAQLALAEDAALQAHLDVLAAAGLFPQ